MWYDYISLIGCLIIILLSCELFTNGIEWLGKILKMGDGVVGSLFSAVGTCLPETMIPIIAILFSKGTQDAEDIGIGAVMGAPFMLSTLAFFITGLSVMLFWKQRKSGMVMHVNHKILRRDIGFFIIVYMIGIGSAFIQLSLVKTAVALLLFACYGFYIYLTVKGDYHSHNEIETLYLAKFFKAPSTTVFIVIQIILALAGIMLGAKLFVINVEKVSHFLGISALILSLIITPIATELPEKFNSVLWIRKRKDTLALGNITGAMVFQSCIPVAIGILATPWVLDIKVILSAVMALISGIAVFLWITFLKKLNPIPLLFGGLLYVVFIVYLFSNGLK